MPEHAGSALETLRESGEFTTYRGQRQGDPFPVLIVALTVEQPSPQSLQQLEHEYALAAELDPAWAARPLALGRHEGRTILVLKDPGGEPLDRVLESELFGYERGAFTGAHQAKAGQIELASMGVLFLDEVSEMSLTAQAKLLRVLQEREFQRLGGTRLVKANVRVIAASNRDLQRAVTEGSLREDLFYRLRVFDIEIPPLRERRRDIPLLTEAFLQEFSRSTGCSSAGLTPDAREMLLGYAWPGNVRELHNALERAAILCQGGCITAEHLSLGATGFAMLRRPPILSDVERRTIEEVLRGSNGNKAKAARKLGITRTQLYSRLRKYGLDTARTP